MIEESFFDSDNKEQIHKIWEKPTMHNDSIQKLLIDANDIFYKKSKKSNKLKKQLFIISKTSLYYCKNEISDRISGMMDLTCARVEFI